MKPCTARLKRPVRHLSPPSKGVRAPISVDPGAPDGIRIATSDEKVSAQSPWAPTRCDEAREGVASGEVGFEGLSMPRVGLQPDISLKAYPRRLALWCCRPTARCTSSPQDRHGRRR